MSFENIDLHLLAGRLVEARRRAGFTQEDVAERLDCSRPTVIAMEKGTRRPKPQELVKLSEMFKEPLNRLLRNEPLPKDIRPHLRGLLSNDAKNQGELDQAIDSLARFIDDYQALERLSEARPVSNIPPPVRIPHGQIERFAEHCAAEARVGFKLGDQPIILLRRVLEEAGVRIFVSGLGSALAGLYAFVPEFGHCILVNAKHPRTRRRWTIAHEYGHFLIDRDKPGVDFLRPMARKPLNERFADAFANAFLMPESGVRRHFFEVVNRSGDFKVGDLCGLGDLYDVSFAAMTLRLEGLGLISNGTWEELKAAKVEPTAIRRELGLQEPALLDTNEPFPERYKMLAVRAFLEARITEGQLAKFLHCDRLRAREIVIESSMSSDADDHDFATLSLPLAKSLLSDETYSLNG